MTKSGKPSWMKGKPIRVGVIGVGRGQSFTRGATDLVGMKLVAICDTWKERLAPVGKQYNVSTYTDYDKFLEHDMDAVFAVADQLTVMVNGTVLASGSPAAVRASPIVQQVYLGEHIAHGALDV
jgi:predicted homoserine dehydrogenase-like protein